MEYTQYGSTSNKKTIVDVTNRIELKDKLSDFPKKWETWKPLVE